MKRLTVISCLLCLFAGFLAGGLLPMPWDREKVPPAGTIVQPPASSGSQSGNAAGSPNSTPAAALNSSDNFTLLGAAGYVAEALRDGDYAALAAIVHPEKGVTFTPYSSVDSETDNTLTKEQIRTLTEDSTVYTWGFTDGAGDPIRMTAAQYLAAYVFDKDYTRAPQVGIDRVMVSGNSLENVAEAYPGCRFVDFSFPGTNGTDWTSLKVVLEPGGDLLAPGGPDPRRVDNVKRAKNSPPNLGGEFFMPLSLTGCGTPPPDRRRRWTRWSTA